MAGSMTVDETLTWAKFDSNNSCTSLEPAIIASRARRSLDGGRVIGDAVNGGVHGARGNEQVAGRCPAAGCRRGGIQCKSPRRQVWLRVVLWGGSKQQCELRAAAARRDASLVRERVPLPIQVAKRCTGPDSRKRQHGRTAESRVNGIGELGSQMGKSAVVSPTVGVVSLVEPVLLVGFGASAAMAR